MTVGKGKAKYYYLIECAGASGLGNQAVQLRSWVYDGIEDYDSIDCLTTEIIMHMPRYALGYIWFCF